MMYFKNAKTAEDAKKLYKELAKKFHPDCGGDAEEFKKMQVEFTQVWQRVKNIHKCSDDKKAETEKEYYEATGKYATSETAEEFIEVIEIILHHKDIDAEICGRWLWIGGDTFPVRQELKDAGCRWSNSKKKWYYTHDDLVPYKKSRYSMNQIRKTYGSEKVDLRANGKEIESA